MLERECQVFAQSKHQVLGFWMEYQLLCVQRGFQVLTLGAGTPPPRCWADKVRVHWYRTYKVMCSPKDSQSDWGALQMRGHHRSMPSQRDLCLVLLFGGRMRCCCWRPGAFMKDFVGETHLDG